MKIKLGKFYKTRMDEKVRIYCLDASSKYPQYTVQGAKYDPNSQAWIMQCWEQIPHLNEPKK